MAGTSIGTMRHRAVVVDHFGGPEALRIATVESPPPPAGHARVRVLAASVGATDVVARRGAYVLQRRTPFTPGYDLVGEILDVGPHDVGPGALPDGAEAWAVPGARVAACLTHMGAHREVVTLPLSALVPVPAGLDTVTAAAVPLDYLTAGSLLTRHARVSPGDTVVVLGATGGVGDAVLQLGALGRLQLVGTASARSIGQLAGRPGVVPVDRDRDDLAAAVRTTAPGGAQAVLDPLVGPDLRAHLALLAPGGTLVGYAIATRPGHLVASAVGGMVRFGVASLAPGRRTAFCSVPREIRADTARYRESLAGLLGHAARGEVRPRVGATVPFEDAATAYDAVEHRSAGGKVVLTFA